MPRNVLIGVIALVAAIFAPAASARSIFLNGIDVSSARNQTLRNVQIKINENGDIFIIAPHYQVNEEETYTPLSRYVPGSTGPAHIQEQTKTTETVKTTETKPVVSELPTTQTDTSEKAGTKTTP